MKVAFVALLAVIATTVIHSSAHSNGKDILCDIRNTLFGCPPGMWANGDRLRCTSTGRWMTWASAPVRSSVYKIYAGSRTTAQTAYFPGELVDILIDTLRLNMKIRGLMMYAVDSAYRKVGTWHVSPDEPALFSNMALINATCGPATFIHTSAHPKPMSLRLKWRAPNPGVGTVTFWVLIKEGAPNDGGFYYPDREIALTQTAMRKPTLIWLKSDRKQSCTQKCSSAGMQCHAPALESLNTPAGLLSALNANHTCKLPILSGCTVLGSSASWDDLCYYDDPACSSQGRTAPPSTCDALSGNMVHCYRFCPCLPVVSSAIIADALLDPLIPDPTDATNDLGPDEPENGNGPAFDPPSDREAALSSASTSLKASSALLALVAGLVGFACACARARNVTVVAVILAVLLMSTVPGADAHNWIRSLSRSQRVANTLKPCQPRYDPTPHVQVGPGQPFQIEWDVGHTGASYFVFVRAENAHRLALHTPEMIEDYIASAPSTAVLPGKRYYRGDTRVGPPPTGFYSKIIPNTDPEFRARPSEWGDPNPTTSMADLSADARKNDRRVAYTHGKYNWIIAAHKFDHNFHRPFNGEFAEFTIPGSTPGDYVIHWFWRGFSDCIDAQLVATRTTAPYGILTSSPTWQRIDHCYAPDPISIMTMCQEVIDSPKMCQKWCSWPRCSAIVVAPFSSPAARNYKFDYIPPICRTERPLNESVVKNVDNQLFCWGVQPRTATDIEGPFETTDDPADPRFFSTCYTGRAARTFPGAIASNFTAVPWRFHDKCISCGDRILNRDLRRTPVWRFPDRCVNCDLEGGSTPTPTWQGRVTHSESRCDGTANRWTNSANHKCSSVDAAKCNKYLSPIRAKRSHTWPPRNYFMHEFTLHGECATLASRDPDCSDRITVMLDSETWADADRVHCYCFTKQSCCGTCIPVPAAGSSVQQAVLA